MIVEGSGSYNEPLAPEQQTDISLWPGGVVYYQFDGTLSKYDAEGRIIIFI